MARFKRGAVISDLHCGHMYGLTPPQYWSRDENVRDVQEETWKWFKKESGKLGKLDFLLINGDAIDGKGERSGGIEQITTDRVEQCAMAYEVITECFDTKEIYVVSGTPYHTGKDESYDKVLASLLPNATCHDTLWLNINGKVINARHHIGSSSTPQGKHTAIAKANMWNVLASARADEPRANIIFRSHVHYYSVAGGAGWWGCTTPGLQVSSKFGDTKCVGTTDYGFLSFSIDSKGVFMYQEHLANLECTQQQPIRI